MKKSVTAKEDEHSLYWPHSKSQDEKLNLWFGRFEHWLKIFDHLTSVFRVLYKVECKTVADLSKLDSKLTLSQYSSEDILKPLHDYVSKMKDEHSHCEGKIWSFTMKSILELRLSTNQKIKSFKKQTEELSRSIRKERELTLDLIHTHQRAKVQTQSQHNNSSSREFDDAIALGSVAGTANRRGEIDPWLAEQVLYNRLDKMVNAESFYQDSIKRIIRSMYDLDVNIVKEWQKIFKDFAAIKNSEWYEIQHKLVACSLKVSEIAPTDNIDIFVQNNDCSVESNWSVSYSLESFPYKIKDIAVVKHASVQRPGTIRKSKWKNCEIVLTESGWFHCFERSKVSKSGSTPSTMRRSATIQSTNSTNQQQQYGNDALFTTISKPKTFYSVCLASPRVSIEIVQEKVHLHVFEIVVRKAKSTTENQYNYRIKTSSEAEMIEWVAELKKMTQSFVPDAPPSPLYTSKQGLNVKLDKAINALSDSTVNIEENDYERIGDSNELSTTLEDSKKLREDGNLVKRKETIRSVDQVDQIAVVNQVA